MVHHMVDGWMAQMAGNGPVSSYDSVYFGSMKTWNDPQLNTAQNVMENICTLREKTHATAGEWVHLCN